MATIVAKIKDLKYDELLVMNIVENNEDLLEIFQSKIKMPFTILYTLQKEDKLNDETKDILLTIFEKIILTSNELLDKYQRLASSNGVDVTFDGELAIEEPIVEPKTTKKPIAKAKVTEEVKKDKLPRRYGKDSIVKDIAKQGGVATSAQRAALVNNDTKNTYVLIEKRLIKTLLSEGCLTPEQCTELEMAGIMFQRKVNSILNPNKKKKNGK
jgi:hypothetical protein